jgi:light-regulated signal transduction histidine kinase (bacteriophytochrome)
MVHGSGQLTCIWRKPKARLHNIFNACNQPCGQTALLLISTKKLFVRLHVKTKYSGTGVGLSIVKKVVENHDGFKEVDSEVNEGLVFKMYLPV